MTHGASGIRVPRPVAAGFEPDIAGVRRREKVYFFSASEEEMSHSKDRAIRCHVKVSTLVHFLLDPIWYNIDLCLNFIKIEFMKTSQKFSPNCCP